MSVKEITKRIDANIFDIDIKDFSPKLNKRDFKHKFEELIAQTHGELVVKYCSAGTNPVPKPFV
jgi:hypothetical protein